MFEEYPCCQSMLCDVSDGEYQGKCLQADCSDIYNMTLYMMYDKIDTVM